MITPVILWNARHGWASFEFQGARGVPGGGLRPAQFLTMALGEIAFLSPWIFAMLVAGLVSAFRRWRDDRYLFLLCLSLPPIVLFTLTPLWGGRGQPHWTMPGWFFAFPLLGAWVDQFGVSSARFGDGLWRHRRCWRRSQAPPSWTRPQAGRWRLTAPAPAPPIPCWRAFDWRDLAKAPIFDPPPSFIISTKWSDAGKIALALGPRIPVFVLSNDPRGWAFWTTARASSAGAASSSRRPRTPHRRAPSPVPISPGWDSPSFMRWAVSVAQRSSSLSSRPPA